MKSLWFALILLVAGCRTAPQQKFTFTPLAGTNVFMLMLTNQIYSANCRVISSTYAAPSTNWVNKVFTPAYKKFLFDNHLKTFVTRENDCVRFSIHAQSLAYRLYAHDKNKLPKQALPVGVFDYLPMVLSMEGHEIVIFITYDAGEFRPVFYEPQSQRIVDLNLFDIITCFYWGI